MAGGGDQSLPYPWLMRNNVTIKGQWMYSPDAISRLLAMVKGDLFYLTCYRVTEFALAKVADAIAHAASTSGPFIGQCFGFSWLAVSRIVLRLRRNGQQEGRSVPRDRLLHRFPLGRGRKPLFRLQPRRCDLPLTQFPRTSIAVALRVEFAGMPIHSTRTSVGTPRRRQGFAAPGLRPPLTPPNRRIPCRIRSACCDDQSNAGGPASSK